MNEPLLSEHLKGTTMLLEEIKSNAAASSESAKQDYSDIVNRASSPLSGDAVRLIDVMTALGITHADLESDIAATERAATLKSQITTEDQDQAFLQPHIKAAAIADKVRRDCLADLVRNVTDPYLFYRDNMLRWFMNTPLDDRMRFENADATRLQKASDLQIAQASIGVASRELESLVKKHSRVLAE